MSLRDVQPTTEQLQRALMHIASRQRRCPGTLESCLAAEPWATCVRALAKDLALRELRQRRTTAKPQPLPALRPLPTFDARRAAAGDRDDD